MSPATENPATRHASGPGVRRISGRVPVSPDVLRWAIARSVKDPDALRARFPKLDAWEQGATAPTMRQLEDFAKATYAPLGYFFLPEPPVEAMPIPDLRTIGDQGIVQPSGNMLDTIYICQRRQDWYREYALSIGEEPLPFIGSARIDDSVVDTAAQMRRVLNLTTDGWRQHPDWETAFRAFIRQVEDAGILVMLNGVVENNTHRKLDPREFRGFALCDDLAPLVFINNADAKAAQLFTLAHELAHLWHGESALSDISLNPASDRGRQVEKWCNRIAAELLLPLADLESILPPGNPLVAVELLRRQFKVSALVVLRRLYEAGRLSESELQDAYEDERQRLRSLAGSGGNFYPTLMTRVGRRFSHAVMRTALSGSTLYRDAYSLLGIRKTATFDELRAQLGY